MGRSKMKFYIYKISTPIISSEIKNGKEEMKFLQTYFNYNISLYCIRTKEMKTRLNRIKTFEKSKTIVLDRFFDNYNQNFAFGEFLTIAHGVKATSVEVKKLTKTKDFNENEGIVNKVMFFIDKRNGFLYVEHDRNNVLSMTRIQSYFSEMSERKNYYKFFNELNKPSCQIDTHRRLIDISTLQPLDFIEQVKNIENLHDIEIPLNITSYEEEDSGVLSSLRQKANEGKIGKHKARIVLEDFNFKKMSDELLKFIKYLQQSDLYENLKVKGTLNNNNILRVFTPETRTKDIMFEVEKNINGWIDKDLAFDRLLKIINEDKQLNVIYEKGNVKEVSIKSCLIDLAREKMLKILKQDKKKKSKKHRLKLKEEKKEWYYK